jgi:hypothetical protein
MTRVALIERSTDEAGAGPFRAVSRGKQAMGRTPGEALYGLAALLAESGAETLVIVRRLQADRFFGEDQRRRLADLVALREEARAGRGVWTPEQEDELAGLIDAELAALAELAEALIVWINRYKRVK